MGQRAHLGGLWVAVVTKGRCVTAGSRHQASTMMEVSSGGALAPGNLPMGAGMDGELTSGVFG
jgi:hypothetical protein